MSDFLELAYAMHKLYPEAFESAMLSALKESAVGRSFDFAVPDVGEAGCGHADLLAESLDILYSQLEAQIVTSRLNPENLAIETWTECDETSFRVCARFVPRKEAV